MPQIGEQVFYKNGPNNYPQKRYIVGENRRSWYMHRDKNIWWAGDKAQMRQYGNRYEKNAVVFIAEEEYVLSVWAQDNRGDIQRLIWRITPEQLRQVAAIIGYEK